ncbi:hypothetical protein ACJ41O_006690 [Fusarium nematophilum]
MAAYVLERQQVQLHSTAAVSLMRNSNHGPHQLIWELIPAFPKGWNYNTLPLLLLLLTTSILSQFSSTALLSDLRTGSTASSPRTYLVSYGAASSPDSYIFKGVDYWSVKPPFYPAFAEFSEAPVVAEGIIDTGRTLRAMLPFPSELNRTAVGNYTGMASVLNARAACIRPDVKANLLTFAWVPRLSGTLHAAASFPELQGLVTSFDSAFNCSVPLPGESPYKRAAKEWATSICRIASSDPLDLEDTVYGGAFLFLNITKGFNSDYLLSKDNRRYSGSVRPLAGPWTGLSFAEQNIDISASVCFYRGNSSDRYVQLSSATARTEPSLGWVPAEQTYESRAIRLQLGATPGQNPSLEERGILALDGNIDTTKFGPNVTEQNEATALSLKLKANITVAMCMHCQPDIRDESLSFQAHRAQIAIFQDILSTTGNPALALQAHYTTLFQVAYYDFLPEFDVAMDSSVVFFVPALMPQRWAGFAAVVAVVGVHFVCVVVSLFLFVSATEYSLLGNAWQVVAQAATGDAEVQAALSGATISVCFIYLRHRRATTAQNVEEWPYRSVFQPVMSYVSGSVLGVLMLPNGFVNFIDGLWNTSNFITAYIGIPIFLVFYVGHKFTTGREDAWMYALGDVDLTSGMDEVWANDGPAPRKTGWENWWRAVFE